MKRKRKNKEESNLGAPAWMTTFSDLMTLLLTFFILLYSMSTVDTVKFKDIAYSLQSILLGEGKTTIFENESYPDDIPIEDLKPAKSNEIEAESDISDPIIMLYDKVKGFIESEGLEAEVSVSASEKGVFVNIQDVILFEPGKAELKVRGKKVIDKIQKIIKQFPNEIVVEGHTDNVPIHTSRYPSNWELSVDRAVTVVRYLSETKNIDPTRLSAVGYGEYKPVAPNDTRENKQLNRRVSILIVINEKGSENSG